MLRFVAHSTVALMLLALVAPSAMAQPQDVPFTGVVVEDGVKVRAGAGRAYYVVGELRKGTIVQVDEVIFGWNRIVSPPGVTSYISKAFVDAKGNGQVGYVNSDRVEVKAGSIKGPGESYRGQVQLNKGDSVNILAEEGSYYRITPPKGAYVFLPPGSVRRADPARAGSQRDPAAEPPADAAAAGATDKPAINGNTAADPADGDAGDTRAADDDAAAGGQVADVADADDEAVADVTPTPTPTLSDAMTTQPPPVEPILPRDRDEVQTDAVADSADAADSAADGGSASADATPSPDSGDAAADAQSPIEMTKAGSIESAAVSEALKALEARMIPLFMQPLEKQPIDQMIAAYEAIQRQSLPTIDRQIVSLRLAVLHRNAELAQVLRKVQETTEQTTMIALPEATEATTAAAGGPVSYDAVGKLLASTVYDGVHLPRMFRVVDPASGRTILWVEPGGPVDPQQYLGKVVGLVGPQQYDPALKFNVLDVRRIDILEAQPTP